jgi:hypothetical protein
MAKENQRKSLIPDGLKDAAFNEFQSFIKYPFSVSHRDGRKYKSLAVYIPVQIVRFFQLEKTTPLLIAIKPATSAEIEEYTTPLKISHDKTSEKSQYHLMAKVIHTWFGKQKAYLFLNIDYERNSSDIPSWGCMIVSVPQKEFEEKNDFKVGSECDIRLVGMTSVTGMLGDNGSKFRDVNLEFWGNTLNTPS